MRRHEDRLRVYAVVALSAFLAASSAAACGASARQKALRAAYATVSLAGREFAAWDRHKQFQIVDSSRTEEEKIARLAEYRHKRERVVLSFTAAWKLLAAANYDGAPLADVLVAVDAVSRAVAEMRRAP